MPPMPNPSSPFMKKLTFKTPSLKNLRRGIYGYSTLSRFANSLSRIAAHPLSLAVILIISLIWVGIGPFVDFSDRWEIAFSAFTMVISFVLLFVILHTQQRGVTGIQLKLNELIRAHNGAHNALLDVEELTDRDLDKILLGYIELASNAREELRRGAYGAATAVVEVRSLTWLVDPAATLADIGRLSALEHLELLDTPSEQVFDALTLAAKLALNIPTVLISLVDSDRQFFKSTCGLAEPWASAKQTPLSHSFCQYAVVSREPFIVNDARNNPIVANNNAIQDLGVIAYCGIPLITLDGYAIGSLCAIDSQPRVWHSEEVELLKVFSIIVMSLIQIRQVSTTAAV
jgi:low affinity Fe/Cu permease